MSLSDYSALDEHLFSCTLPNGLTVKVVPRPGFSRKIAYFVTDFGSIHTQFSLAGRDITVPDGIAHFLEHKMFELPGRDVSAEFAALGGSVNAFTSFDMTAYYFSCTEHFAENLRLLLEFVSTPYFPEESVRREMGIIDQEIGMNDDSPDTQVFENLTKAMYRRHSIRVPILGTRESLRRITPQLLEDCHRAFYTPKNMILCVVGDVQPEEVCQIARSVLGDGERDAAIKHRPWQEEMTCEKHFVSQKMEVSMPSFQLGFKCEPLQPGLEAVRREIIAELAAEILFGESSELYLQLYGQGLIDASFGGGFETVDGCALLTCGGDSDHPEKVRSAILAQAQKLQQEGIPQDSLQRLQRSSLGRRIRDLDSFDSTCFRLCAYHFSHFDYFRFPELYQGIQTQDILSFLAETVTESRCALSVIYPN